MRVKVWTGFTNGEKEITIPNNMCVYKQDYNGVEYILFSKTPIYLTHYGKVKTTELDGKLNKRIGEIE